MYIGLDVNDAVEPGTATPGEYGLIICNVIVKDRNATEKNPSGVGQMLRVDLTIVGADNVKGLVEHFMLPHDDFEKSTNDFFALNLKRFLEACGMESVLNDSDDLVGKNCSAILTETDDAKYGMQNTIQRFLAKK